MLGGSRVDRWMEALELYRAGYAPAIVLSPGGRETGELRLAEQGIQVPNDADIARELLTTRFAVPVGSVIIVPAPVDNTAQEAQAIAAILASHRWHRVIVITSRSSTRRAAYAFRRELGEAVTVIMRDTRFESYNPRRWWATRSDFRATFYEAPKLLAYWLGLRG